MPGRGVEFRLLRHDPITPQGTDRRAGLYLWLGLVGGLLAYTLWFRGIGRLPITATALLVLLSPLTAAMLGAAFLGERFTTVQGLGFALALLALMAGQVPGRVGRRSARRMARDR